MNEPRTWRERAANVRSQSEDHGAGPEGNCMGVREVAMSFLRSRVLFFAVAATLMSASSLALGGVAPAGATPGVTVHCPADLQSAISGAAPGSTVVVDGTCTGTFVIFQDLTLTGPATLNGGGSG